MAIRWVKVSNDHYNLHCGKCIVGHVLWGEASYGGELGWFWRLHVNGKGHVKDSYEAGMKACEKAFNTWLRDAELRYETDATSTQ